MGIKYEQRTVARRHTDIWRTETEGEHQREEEDGARESLTSPVQSGAEAPHTQQHTLSFGHFIIMWTVSWAVSDCVCVRMCVCVCVWMHTLLLTFIYPGKVDRALCIFFSKTLHTLRLGVAQYNCCLLVMNEQCYGCYRFRVLIMGTLTVSCLMTGEFYSFTHLLPKSLKFIATAFRYSISNFCI